MKDGKKQIADSSFKLKKKTDIKKQQFICSVAMCAIK